MHHRKLVISKIAVEPMLLPASERHGGIADAGDNSHGATRQIMPDVTSELSVPVCALRQRRSSAMKTRRDKRQSSSA